MTTEAQPVTPTTSEMPDLPDILKVANRPALGGTPKTLNMIKEAAMAKAPGTSKLDQLRALRENRAKEAEDAIRNRDRNRVEAAAGRDPGALAARDRLKAEQKAKAAATPKRKPLNWKDGTAKAKHAHYTVSIDDSGEPRQYILTATTDQGAARIGEYEQPTQAREAAEGHHFELVTSGAPIYKPTPEKKESTVSAKKKPKAKAKKATTKTSQRMRSAKKADKAKVAKSAKPKTAAKANARKAVKGKTTAKAPAAGKGADLIARMQKGWVSAVDVCKEFGWLPHTLRGFLSRVRETHNVESDRREDGTHYRIK